MNDTSLPETAVVVYKAPGSEHAIDLPLDLDNRTVWTTQRQIAEALGLDVRTISEHVGNFKKDHGERVNRSITTSAVVVSDGKKYLVEHYDMTFIINIVFRVQPTERIIDLRNLFITALQCDHSRKGFQLSSERLDRVPYKVRIHLDDTGKTWYVFPDVYQALRLEPNAFETIGQTLFSELPEEHKRFLENDNMPLIDKTAFATLAIQTTTNWFAWVWFLFVLEAKADKEARNEPPAPKRKNWRAKPEMREQFTRQNGMCYYCKEPLMDGWVVEHVKPFSKGGDDKPHNLVIACPTCNGLKSDKSPHEWPAGGRLC